MNTKEVLRHIDKYWNTAIKSLHDTAPQNKSIPTTSGNVEKNLHRLYQRHRENLKEIFGNLEDAQKH